jgi:oxygen-independent coproporphyrinogen-3 oxidase
MKRWLEAFKREAERAGLYLGGDMPVFDSIHLGGGTPSFLESSMLAELMGSLRSAFHFKEDCETTLEANPLDLTPEKAAFLKLTGFTRIVVGAQSFNPSSLSFLGRGHLPGDCREALAALRDAGFDNIGIDLIYGFNHQGVESFLEDLQEALSFNPSHLSCYCLSIEEGTAFWSMAEKGLLKPMEPERERELFLAGAGLLEKKGYIHYEVSNFARTAQEVSRHNLRYWRREPYLGLGPSAHSFDGRRRWWNVRSVRSYCEAIEKGLSPVEGSEDLSREQAALERISLGLRIREGFRLDEELRPFIRGQGLRRMIEEGFVALTDGVVAPTTRGLLVADGLPLEITI